MKNRAFTIVEVMVCVLIIGVMTVVTLNITMNKSANQYAKLYYAAYNSLVQAVGNAYLDWQPDENNLSNCLEDGKEYYWSRQCWSAYTGTLDGMRECRRNENGEFDTEYCEDSDEGIWYYPYKGERIILKGKHGETNESTYYGGVLGYPRRYPGFLMGKNHDNGDYLGGRYDGWGTDFAFCKDIVKYYNTLAKRSECQSFINGMREIAEGDVENPKGYAFHEVFCVAQPPEGATEATGICQHTRVNMLEPSFIASNGQKFYISGLVTANLPFLCAYGDDACKRERVYFRLIAVDLNGDSGPNRQYATGASFPWTNGGSYKDIDSGNYPDIVLFAITDNGNVIPLGLPEFSTVYAMAKVYYPEYLNKMVTIDGVQQFEQNSQETSTSMNIYDAKLTAWGDNSANAPNLVCEQPIIKNAPITYSELFYWIALNCAGDGCGKRGKISEEGEGKKDYRVCLSGTSTENTPLFADKLMGNIVRQFIFKEPGEVVFGSRNNTFIPTASSNDLLDSKHGCVKSSTKCKVQIELE